MRQVYWSSVIAVESKGWTKDSSLENVPHGLSSLWEHAMFAFLVRAKASRDIGFSSGHTRQSIWLSRRAFGCDCATVCTCTFISSLEPLQACCRSPVKRDTRQTLTCAGASSMPPLSRPLNFPLFSFGHLHHPNYLLFTNDHCLM